MAPASRLGAAARRLHRAQRTIARAQERAERAAAFLMVQAMTEGAAELTVGGWVVRLTEAGVTVHALSPLAGDQLTLPVDA